MAEFGGALLILAVLVSQCLSSAPDDADSFCIDGTLSSTSTPPPVYPPNSRILMDSYHYINLLPPHVGPVWQMVDNDTNNQLGRGTEWTQNTNIPCRQTVNACGFAVGTQNNWLITQHIRRTVRNYTRVSVLVEFELRGCDTVACRRTFAVYKYESSELNPSEARNISRFQRAGRIATEDDTGQTIQNRTIEVDLETDEDGFYLAIVDETTCIGVTRVIVFYTVCPGGVDNLMNRSETLAPHFDRNSQPIAVSTQCVDEARPENGLSAMVYCSPEGVWFPIPGAGCQCNPGFEASEDRRSCVECPVGMYLPPNQQECRICPENSQSETSGLSECPCLDGFYRLPEEVDLQCTMPPSEPRNLVITSTTPSSVSLAWDPPESLGERNDTVYTLWYQEEGSGERVRAGNSSDNLNGVIMDLQPGTQYRFFVSAANGVSELAAMDVLNVTLAFVDGRTSELQFTTVTMTSLVTSSVTPLSPALGLTLGVTLGALALVDWIVTFTVFNVHFIPRLLISGN